ncbi:MAG TPA: carboxylesterase family protein [Bryobacteraceae bacterium]|nr:carboxylesterase family protein [Bryobacteraceae bacterium]
MRSPRLLLAVLCAAAPLFAINDPVKTSNGLVSGAPGRDASVHVYKGIPYAAPPVGSLRWKEPKPAASWDGVRKADKFSSACVQAPYPKNSVYYNEPEPTNEDCLYLNLWTPAKSAREKRPVMVWIHGGALTRGSGSIPIYDGENLAKKGAVVVTINYRLGLFGFFAHPELTKESDRNSSGNYGILDQIAALEWVQKNIGAFGGDPKRVTIFGESAGSWSVNCLMATPLAKGLFQRAIGESGADFQPLRKLKEAEEAGVKIATSMGAHSIAELREKSADEVLKAGPAIAYPTVDGWMLPADVYTIFANGKQSDVPLLVGSNANEFTTLTPPPTNLTAAAFKSQIRNRFGPDADKILAVYPADNDDQAKESFLANLRDVTFTWQMRTWSRLEAKTGKSNVFLYFFTRPTPGPDSKRNRAYHASEIAYAFNNLTDDHPWEDTDRRLADIMSSYWVNFATNGNPNGKGLPAWPKYTEAADQSLELGEQIKPLTNLQKQALDALDEYYSRVRGN